MATEVDILSLCEEDLKSEEVCYGDEERKLVDFIFENGLEGDALCRAQKYCWYWLDNNMDLVWDSVREAIANVARENGYKD